jgi:hypothetical protein
MSALTVKMALRTDERVGGFVEFESSTVLVTGAAKGIGCALAEDFLGGVLDRSIAGHAALGRAERPLRLEPRGVSGCSRTTSVVAQDQLHGLIEGDLWSLSRRRSPSTASSTSSSPGLWRAD